MKLTQQLQPLETPYWVFDLDGTLTEPILDFPKIKRQLGLPIDRGILEVMATMDQQQSDRVAVELEAIEYECAGKAVAARGAVSLLAHLKSLGVTMGILTRNKKSHALHTLDVLGMGQYFEETHVLGRDEAEHKPSPEGIVKLLSLWNTTANQALMVGDYLFDLKAAQAAGVARIYVDGTGKFPYAAEADLSIQALDQLLG